MDRNSSFQGFYSETLAGTRCRKTLDLQGSKVHLKRSDRHVCSSCCCLNSYLICFDDKLEKNNMSRGESRV